MLFVFWRVDLFAFVNWFDHSIFILLLHSWINLVIWYFAIFVNLNSFYRIHLILTFMNFNHLIKDIKRLWFIELFINECYYNYSFKFFITMNSMILSYVKKSLEFMKIVDRILLWEKSWMAVDRIFSWEKSWMMICNFVEKYMKEFFFSKNRFDMIFFY